MARHELDLRGNALDSFNEAMRRYRDGVKGDTPAYKFAILHFAHFIELLLKYFVTLSHPLLLYKDPFAKNVEKRETINIWQALQFLKNNGHQFGEEFEKDLSWLKKLRNEIEHHKFAMNEEEVRDAIGRLTKTTIDFSDRMDDFEIRDHIDAENFEVFEALAREYERKVAAAVSEAEDSVPPGTEILYCYSCGEPTAAPTDQGEYYCFFCKETDQVHECAVCGDSFRESEMSVWNEEYGDYICDGCDTRIMGG